MSGLLCCARFNTGEEGERKTEGDYLLPGGEWDPSISSRASSIASSRSNRVSETSTSSGRFWTKRGRRGKRSSRNSTNSSLEAQSPGEYQPPPLVPSRTLPTIEEFKLLKTVGRGAFGKVMLAVHSETRILYALKVVPKAKITTQKQVEQIFAETQILKSIRHPFCIALQYAFQNDDFLFYVFEFAAGGMLFYHLKKDGRFTEPRGRFYFGEIILALDYLHSFGIIFRDLKPENCMLSERGHILLTDFGSAKRLEVAERTNTIAGTPQYIAPEVLRGEPYSFSADWWSCGILLYEMLTGRTPFFSADRVELYKLVLRGSFLVPRSVSPRAKSLLHRLISKNQDERIGCTCGSCQYHSAADIKQHTFFSQTPMDSEEEERYTTEEAEREWERKTHKRRQRSRNNSFLDVAGDFVRSVSISARRMSMNTMPAYSGVPCEWTWEQLEGREVLPPFKPKLASPTDLRHFDPTLTCIPPTLLDLVTTERSLHVDDFDYVAPEDQTPIAKSKKPGEEGTTEIEAVGVASEVETNSAEAVVQITGSGIATLENSTDEEKVLARNDGVTSDGDDAQLSSLEGQFVEGKLERSTVPYPAKVLVTASVNPQ